MSVVAVDTEITTWNKGHPFDERNKAVCWSYANGKTSGAVRFPDATSLSQLLHSARAVVVFNGKFDLQWFAKLGIPYDSRKIWDVQLAEFILSNQTEPFPSLEETAQKYGFGGKLDVIKTEYWDKGINTDEIPWDVLSAYATLDAELTLKCYYAQRELMTPAQIRLCQLQSQDLSILREMEWNGIPFDEDLCRQRSFETEKRIEEIKLELEKYLVFTSSRMA